MVKSYIIAGSLLLTSLVIIGGISFNSSQADRTTAGSMFSLFSDDASTQSPTQSSISSFFQDSKVTNTAVNREATSGVNSSFYNLFAATEPVKATSEEGAQLVPLPYWLLQKLLSDGEVTSTPAPCPVWLLYQLGVTQNS